MDIGDTRYNPIKILTYSIFHSFTYLYILGFFTKKLSAGSRSPSLCQLSSPCCCAVSSLFLSQFLSYVATSLPLATTASDTALKNTAALGKPIVSTSSTSSCDGRSWPFLCQLIECCVWPLAMVFHCLDSQGCAACFLWALLLCHSRSSHHGDAG